MGNEVSSKGRSEDYSDDETDTGPSRTKSRRRRKHEEDVPNFLIDGLCTNFPYFVDVSSKGKKHGSGYRSSHSDDDEDNEDYERRGRKGRKDDDSYSLEDTKMLRQRRKKDDDTLDDEDDDTLIDENKDDERGSVASSINNSTSDIPSVTISKPLASSFAKKCYFTKAGIGKKTQHYEGLTLTGNTVLMLASAMKLKGCPTICDEDLRRVEQTYPNQFSRLPDELLLSSGWRRISKFCHFSNKPIPDGIPFFHSKERLHPQGGYYFLLASAVGMYRPSDVEPLQRDTLVVLETDYSTQCDAAPSQLIRDPEQWTLVDKFCFFSGGPINTEEDVFYVADFDGNPIYMLAFLSPSLTPEELYRITSEGRVDPKHGHKNVAAVEEVERVYDLAERDFDDLKLYHLGPCRALPQYVLSPAGWAKVLPPNFLNARQLALDFAVEYEMNQGGIQHVPNNGEDFSGDYDAYGPPQQWNQPGLGEQHFSQESHYAEGNGYMHGEVDYQMQQQQQQHLGHPELGNMDGSYYAGQQYGQIEMGDPHLHHQDQQYQEDQTYQNTQPQGTHDPAYYDPEFGVDRNGQLPGGYNLPTPHDQNNPDAIKGNEATQFQREVQEEGHFLSGANSSQPMDEAMANHVSQVMNIQPMPGPGSENDAKHQQNDLNSAIRDIPQSNDSTNDDAKKGEQVSHFESSYEEPPRIVINKTERHDKTIDEEDGNYEALANHLTQDALEDRNTSINGGHTPSSADSSYKKHLDVLKERRYKGYDDQVQNIEKIITENDKKREQSLEDEHDELNKNDVNRYGRSLGSGYGVETDIDYEEKPKRKMFESYGDKTKIKSTQDEQKIYDDYAVTQKGYIPSKVMSTYLQDYDDNDEPSIADPSISYSIAEPGGGEPSVCDLSIGEPSIVDEPSFAGPSIVDEPSIIGPSEIDEPSIVGPSTIVGDPSVVGPSIIDSSVAGPSMVEFHQSPLEKTYNVSNKQSSPFSRISDENSNAMSDFGASQTSHASHAMRGAQEILRRNRQRRLAQSNKNASYSLTSPTSENSHLSKYSFARNISGSSDKEFDSASDASGSVADSAMSGSTSGWTDSSMTDRSSRRAFILQMAKARMKGGRSVGSNQRPVTPNNVILEEDNLRDSTPDGELDFSAELD